MWEMNWIALIGAAVAGFVVGGLWYGPLFGKVWQRESGLSDEAIKDANMPLIFGTVFVLNLFAAFILGHVLATYGRPGLDVSAMVGFGIGLGFVATSIGVNYLFARKSLKLFWIDAGYWTVIYTAMGAIFGALR
jgi:Protein of unknown function (DUF1761)